MVKFLKRVFYLVFFKVFENRICMLYEQHNVFASFIFRALFFLTLCFLKCFSLSEAPPAHFNEAKSAGQGQFYWEQVRTPQVQALFGEWSLRVDPKQSLGQICVRSNLRSSINSVCNLGLHTRARVPLATQNPGMSNYWQLSLDTLAWVPEHSYPSTLGTCTQIRLPTTNPQQTI